MKSLVRILFVLFLLNLPFYAQTVNTFSFTTAAVSLPNGKSTIAGTDAGTTLTITPNLDLLERNILGSGNTFQYFAGGAQYRLPVLSTKLNNASPNLDGMKFQFFIRASAGVDRITDATGNVHQHYGFTGGGGVNYLLGSGTWSLGGSVEYAKFPGYANNTWIAEFGPQVHF